MGAIRAFVSKYKNMSVPAKAGIWFTICGFVQKGISFITVPIFARLLTTSQYGITSVYYSWYSLLSIVCTLNLFAGGFNNGMLDYEDRRGQYVSSVQGLVTALSVFWLVVYLLGRNYWNDIMEMSTFLVLVMLVEILTHSALALWSSKQRYEFRYRNLVIITIANAFFASSIAVVAICIFDRQYGAEARIVAHALITAIICGGLYIHIIKKGKRFFDWKIWKGSFLFNVPLLPHYLSLMVLSQADRIMISKMVGTSEAGIYSVAYSAAMILNILVTAANNSFAPWLYGKLKKNDTDGIARTMNVMVIGLALVLGVLIAFAPECVRIFAGSKYNDAVAIIPAVASSLYFIFMYQVFANIEFYYRKNKFIAYASVVGAVLNIVFNYFGIKMFGYIAAGYTTLICYIVFGCAHTIFMRQICKRELLDKKVFDIKTTFIVALALLAFSILINALYGHTLIRYTILLLLITATIWKREKVLSAFKTMRVKEKHN